MVVAGAKTCPSAATPPPPTAGLGGCRPRVKFRPKSPNGSVAPEADDVELLEEGSWLNPELTGLDWALGWVTGLPEYITGKCVEGGGGMVNG